MKFSQILGHEKIKNVLFKIFENQRVAHTYLFCGPEGVGKKMTAISFYQLLCCENPRDGDSCGICSKCSLIEKGQSIDLHIIESEGKGGKIRIDVVRDISQFIRFEPVQTKWKFVLFDNCEKLTDEAQNALLKILEEPPSKTVFCLVTAFSEMLFTTIVSRAQKIHFSEVQKEKIVSLLMQKEGIGLEDAIFYASLSQGSPSLALAYLQMPFLKKRKQILQKFIFLSIDEADKIIEFAELMFKEKENIPYILNLLRIFYRDILMLKLNIENEVVNKDIVDEIKDFGKKISLRKIEENLRKIERADKALNLYINNKLIGNWLFLNLVSY